MIKISLISILLILNIYAQNEKNQEMKDDKRNTILLNVVKQRDILGIQYQLKNKVDVNFHDKKTGKTALHYAVQNNDIDAINILLENGASLLEVDEYGNTPLHLALDNKDKKVIELLVSKGSDINIKNDDGYSVVDLSITDREIMSIIINTQNNADGITTALHKAAKMQEPLVVYDLIKNGAKIDAKDEYGNTALHYSVINQNIKTAEILLENNASFQEKNNYGETPLELAIENGSFEAFTMFYSQIDEIKKSFKKNKRYIKGDDDTVIDNENQIAWQTKLNHNKMTLKEAKDYCLNLELAYYNDWKLPTIDELNSIVDIKRYKPSTNHELFPDTKGFFYWSNSQTDVQNQYYTIDFNYGDKLPKNSNEKIHVRCVRSMN
jgi:ankyrin repeat protein